MTRRSFVAHALSVLGGLVLAPWCASRARTSAEAVWEVTPGGLIVHPHAARDIELIEARRFEVEHIARLFEVPVELIDPGTSWSASAAKVQAELGDMLAREFAARIEHELGLGPSPLTAAWEPYKRARSLW